MKAVNQPNMPANAAWVFRVPFCIGLLAVNLLLAACGGGGEPAATTNPFISPGPAPTAVSEDNPATGREGAPAAVSVADPTAASVGANLPVDSDNNGLIEISTLTQLSNMRFNLAGTSYRTSASDVGSSTGCPEAGCRGYELTTNLDFDSNENGWTWRVGSNGQIELDQGDHDPAYFNTQAGGWAPMGNCGPDGACFDIYYAPVHPDYKPSDNTPFTAEFDGRGHTISGVATVADIQYLGLFGFTHNAKIRNVGLVGNLAMRAGANSPYTGCWGHWDCRIEPHEHDDNAHTLVGGLVGWMEGGSIENSYTTGRVDSGDGLENDVGGLVGSLENGTILSSYATGRVDGGDGHGGDIGGLVGGCTFCTVSDSYATGDVYGGAGNRDNVGGLVGGLGGFIVDSHATGDVYGGSGERDHVGGLIGDQSGSLTITSYATGYIDGGRGGYDIVGGLIGNQYYSETIASYATGDTSGGYRIGTTGGGQYDAVGGLIGISQGVSFTVASYAEGNANGGGGGFDAAGGLIGWLMGGTVTASYATGNAFGGGGTDNSVGSLVGRGYHDTDDTTHYRITASWGFGDTFGGNADTSRIYEYSPSGDSIEMLRSWGEHPSNNGYSGTADRPIGVISATGLTAANVPEAWNHADHDTLGAWVFGTADQPPRLMYADYDGATLRLPFNHYTYYTSKRLYHCANDRANAPRDDFQFFIPKCGTRLPVAAE